MLDAAIDLRKVKKDVASNHQEQFGKIRAYFGRSEWTPAQNTPTSDHAADAEAAEAAHGAVIREHAPRASGESGVVADREPLAAWVRDVSGLEAVAGGKVPVQPPSRHLDQNAGAEAAVGHHGPRQDARRGRRQARGFTRKTVRVRVGGYVCWVGGYVCWKAVLGEPATEVISPYACACHNRGVSLVNQPLNMQNLVHT